MHVTKLLISLSLPFFVLSQCPPGWRPSAIDSNKCYYIAVTKKIWSKAESYCQGAAPTAHLTSIASAFESNSVSAAVLGTPGIGICNQLWIGANDFNQNGQFVWVDGRPFQYSNWDAGQPNLANQCVSSTSGTGNKWKTEPCGTENCFICESYLSPQTTPAMTTSNAAHSMTDCYDWLHFGGATTTGIYRISPPGIDPFDVYCDMDTNGGGWTVIQKRMDNSTRFWNRLWADYKAGFGNALNRNSWIGLDRIHVLTTKDGDVRLRIDLHGNRCVGPNCMNTNDDPNGFWFAEWRWSIGSESDSYTLNVSTPIAGNLTTAGDEKDWLYYCRGQRFATVDNDNNDCSDNGGNLGAWWHNYCGEMMLNGKYDPEDWGDFGFTVLRRDNFKDDYYINPVQSEMKIRKYIAK